MGLLDLRGNDLPRATGTSQHSAFFHFRSYLVTVTYDSNCVRLSRSSKLAALSDLDSPPLRTVVNRRLTRYHDLVENNQIRLLSTGSGESIYTARGRC